jgi:hypothetical protein
LTKTIFYLLTHAWVRDNTFVIRYWGDLSNKRLTRIKLETIKEPVYCPDCGKHLRVMTAGENYQFEINAPHYYTKIPRYKYVRRFIPPGYIKTGPPPPCYKEHP